MLSSTVTVIAPGFTVIWVLSATLLVTVTVTVTHPLAERDPLAGDTVTLPAMLEGTVIV